MGSFHQHYMDRINQQNDESRKLKSERDELAAELERVKAERDSARYQAQRWSELYQKKRKQLIDSEDELGSLKSRLPVNADGDVPDIGDDIWEWYEEHKCPGKNTLAKLLKDKDGWCYIDVYGIRRRPQDFHSTAESCRAANETKEGE